MNLFRVIRTACLKIVRVLLSILIPVKKGRIIFQSSPDYSDNARAFSDYLLDNTNYNLIWAVNDSSLFKDTDRIKFINNDNTKSVFKKLKYIYYTVTSQYLISTHSAFLFANKRKQTFVCLWHGMPLKRIAIWQNPNNKNYLNNTSYILSTSCYYVPILAKCFGKKENEILPLGYPRNDWLFVKSDVLDKLDFKVEEGEKLILFLPTFRQTNGGDYYDTKSDSFASEVVNFRSSDSLASINSFLKSINIKMIIKPHPAESMQTDNIRLSNILIVPHSVFYEKDIQLNQVMHYADALITDFSGAYCDFLNLNRPIGFVLSDFNEYKENRGFVFDNILDYLAGARLYTNQDFKDFCTSVSQGIDTTCQDRSRVSRFFNDNSDANNCYRLAKYLSL